LALVVDLSKPEELWLTLDKWLEVAKARVAAQLTDHSLREKLHQAVWERIGEEHEVQLMLVCFLKLINTIC